MNIPPKLQKQVNKLRASYEGATFEFFQDAKFILLSKDAKGGIEDGYWIFDPVTRIIKVCKWENRNQGKPLLLELSARTEKDGNTYFSLHEVPVA
jgi:hypothetical protein